MIALGFQLLVHALFNFETQNMYGHFLTCCWRQDGFCTMMWAIETIYGGLLELSTWLIRMNLKPYVNLVDLLALPFM